MKDRRLRPHQLKVLKWAQHKSRVGFFLQMRLGKSWLAIEWMKHRLSQMKVSDKPIDLAFGAHRQLKVLILTPVPVIEDWQRELRFLGIEPVILRAPLSNRYATMLENADHQWFIANYEALHLTGLRTARGKVKCMPTLIPEQPWAGVIADESPIFRMPTALKSKVMTQSFAHVPNRCILTGLPNPEGLQDFFCQMLFLSSNGKFMGHSNWWNWQREFFQQSGFSWYPKRHTNTLIREAMSDRVMFMTRKEAGIPDAKVYERRYVDLPTTVRSIYDSTEKEMEIGDKQMKYAVEVRTALMRVTGGFHDTLKSARHMAKAKMILDLLQGDLQKERFVVYCRFNAEVSAIRDLLAEKGFKVHRIVGSTSPQKREDRISRLNAGKLDGLVVQIKCAVYGKNFSGASVCFRLAPTDSSNVHQQSEDRFIHLEKEGPTLYIDILARDTVDEDIHEALQHKGLSSRAFNERVLVNLRKRIEARR